MFLLYEEKFSIVNEEPNLMFHEPLFLVPEQFSVASRDQRYRENMLTHLQFYSFLDTFSFLDRFPQR